MAAQTKRRSAEGSQSRDDQGGRTPGPRERLLAAANELFYAEGVQSVGIDRILERAGVAKASLYSTFGSKEALVRAYLEIRRARVTGHLARAIAGAGNPREQLMAVFDAQGELFREPTYRGCAFVAASAEARHGGLVEEATDEFRGWMRQMFTSLATAAGAPDAEGLGRQLHIIYDGAGLSARLDRNPEVTVAAKAAAVTLFDAALRGAAGSEDPESGPRA